MKFDIAISVLTVQLAFAALAMPSTEPQDRNADFNAMFAERLLVKAAAVRAGGSKVVFVGDSITHNWESSGRNQWQRYFAGEPYRALNLGWAGDRTENTLWRIQSGELDGYEAKAIVLMIGTNNPGRRGCRDTVIDTIAGIWRVIQAIQAKQPTARIILLPIFPRGRTAADPSRVYNNAVNREIMKFADGKRIIWCDFTDQFLEADGTLPREVMPDFLHPQAFGYEIWAAAVMPVIDFCLRAGPDERYPNRYASHLAKDQFANADTRALNAHSEIGVSHDWDPYPNWWLERLIEKREEEFKLSAEHGGEIDLIFAGDSITHNWEGARGPGPGLKELTELRKTYTIVGLGHGGDDTASLLWRLENGQLDGFKTKGVMLMIGTNNRESEPPKETAQGIKAILETIARKQPEAKIILLPIFPCGEKPDHRWRVRNAAVNRLIREYADGEKVIWLDFTEKFVNADGTISKSMMEDFLHPGEEGYAIWTQAVKPVFKTLCGK